MRQVFLLLVLLLPALSACGKGDVYEWRNKYTLTVETASGAVSASSVVGQKLLDRRRNPQFGSGHGWSFAMKGEAVVLDLGEARGRPRYLFALVARSEYLAMSIAARALGLQSAQYADIARRLDELKEPVRVTPDLYPLLVTFVDIADPASVKRVDPYDLAASFGPGFALTLVSLEITDEPVTRGKVKAVLGWLGEHPEPSVVPNISPTDFSLDAKLRHGDFIRR